ncbi:hypothetical protein EU522_01570 [Candidatus Thorarchaeota archaeon]|nr:MAG: hypothetical protein EU522_01570 [Candidatus Thorarchaeota archaeon]
MLKESEVQMNIGPINPVILPLDVVPAAPPNYGASLRVAVGLLVASLLLVPLLVLPGLVVAVLPAEIYLLGQVYDGIVDLRSKDEESSATALREADDKTESARIRVYGSRVVT